MKIKFLITITLLFIFSTASKAYDYSNCNGTHAKPCVVQDTIPNAPTKHWRDIFSIIDASNNKNINTRGLQTLWMSGSATPSLDNLKDIYNHIVKVTKYKVLLIIDVDLRQESHGMLNGEAITLATKNDWINKGDNRVNALNAERKWLNSLSHQKHIVNVLTQNQFKKKIFDAGKTVVIESVTSESTAAKVAGFRYERFTITDHMAPDNGEVDRFISLINTLKPNVWIHFHCRGGDGRTTTFMAMYDMLHNANNVSLEDIIKRQAAVIPYYDLFSRTSANPEMEKYFEERKIFLKKFYLFSKARLNGYRGSWSAWLAIHA